jgi:hypothetical protein
VRQDPPQTRGSEPEREQHHAHRQHAEERLAAQLAPELLRRVRRGDEARLHQEPDAGQREDDDEQARRRAQRVVDLGLARQVVQGSP